MTSSNLPIENLAELYDESPCGYISVTADSRIAKMNRTLAEWLSCSPDDLVGEQLHTILSFGAKIAFETHLAPMLRLQGEAHEIAFDLQVGDGEKIPVFGNAREKRGPNGEHLFTRLTLFKATERLTFERSLVEAKIRADERFKNEHSQLELRDQFIAVLGHDLRNPLAAIEAGTRILERHSDADERVSVVIGEMRASLARAYDLIDDVLDFARGRLGNGIPLDYSNEIGLLEVLRHVVQEITAVASDVEIRCEFGDLDAVEPLVAEVYTFPAEMESREGGVKLTVEAEVIQANCGTEIEAKSFELRGRDQLVTQDLSLAVPDCTALGSFLVLNNLLQDMKVASN